MRIQISKGLDIPIKGTPAQSIDTGAPIHHVALNGRDYVGLKPRMLVAEGDRVALGQPLFTDKRDPAVLFTAPGRGTVVAINRGTRRALETVVIELDEDPDEAASFEKCSADQLSHLDRDEIVARLLESGLWTALRTRPYSRIPASDSVPRSVFVTAIDTQPLAADPRAVLAEHGDAFDTGLAMLSRLTKGPLYLCTGTGWDREAPDIDGLVTAVFDGPHPAGLVGTHIHFLDPVGADSNVWHIGYQDVIAIGKLLATGRVWTERVVALGGDAVRSPRLLTTRLGASTEELTAGELAMDHSCRVISGSVLSGRTAAGHNAFLGRYHNQVSVIGDRAERRFLGWLGPVMNRYTASSVFLRRRHHKYERTFTTAQNGVFSAMLPVDTFEKILPLDILPSPLLRALMVRDTDQAQALGCLELDEEDLALCSFVCPAKYDYGAVLRASLDQIEKEG